MEFKIKITRELVTRSLHTGTPHGSSIVSQNCVLALALKELFPKVTVSVDVGVWASEDQYIGSFPTTDDMIQIMLYFDKCAGTPHARYALVGREIVVDIPDRIIERLYSSHVEIAQKIADSQTLKQIVTP